MSVTTNLIILLVDRELDDLEGDLLACEHELVVERCLTTLQGLKTQLIGLDGAEHLVTRIAALLVRFEVSAPTPQDG